MDSDYSDTESVCSTFSESMQTTDLYESLEVGSNPKAYKLDKNCSGCGVKFGKVGILHAKKHFCKFCYRGVCAKCSPQVAVHPVQLKKLRVCNNCCERAVIHRFTENFKLDYDHAKIQQEQTLEKIEMSKRKKVEIEESMKELTKKHELEMEKEIKFIEMKKNNFELEKKLKDVKDKVEALMILHINAKLEIEGLEKCCRGLESEKMQEIEKDEKIVEGIKNARFELAEKQEERVKIKMRIEEKKHKDEELLRTRKDFDKIEKVRRELHEVNLQMEDELKSKEFLETEIKIYEEENNKLNNQLYKIKHPEANSDSLATSARSEYDENEEQKISELKKILITKKASAEHLRIQLHKVQPKVHDPKDIEHTPADKSRSCVRCLTF